MEQGFTQKCFNCHERYFVEALINDEPNNFSISLHTQKLTAAKLGLSENQLSISRKAYLEMKKAVA